MKATNNQHLQIQGKESWGTVVVSLFPKSSTLVFRLSFPSQNQHKDTILLVFDINK